MEPIITVQPHTVAAPLLSVNPRQESYDHALLLLPG